MTATMEVNPGVTEAFPSVTLWEKFDAACEAAEAARARAVRAAIAERDQVVKFYGAFQGGKETLARLAGFLARK